MKPRLPHVPGVRAALGQLVDSARARLPAPERAAVLDVIVVGAGPAGSATALALRQRGLHVLVIDDGRATPPRMGESLPAVSRLALEELGLWQDFQRQPYRPTYLVRSAWGGELRDRSAIESGYGPDHHLDRAHFDAWLLAHAADAGAQLLRGARVLDARFRPQAQLWELSVTHDGRALAPRARYVIDATGRAAWLSRKLGGVRQHVDSTVGIARWYRETDSEPLVLVEASEHGWWYSAPLPGAALVALFVTDSRSPAARALDRDVWNASLEFAPLTRARLRDAAPSLPARGYAVSPAITVSEGAGAWLGVGDAALAFDPLSAVGLCFALRSALDAARVVRAARDGDPIALERYRTGTRAVFDQHMKQRAMFYAIERRWSQCAFWLARSAGHGVRAPAPSSSHADELTRGASA